MKKLYSCTSPCFLLLLFLALTGCASFRGIPSHGGGKRFSEEQRMLAACIRQSVADIDWQQLRGKRVQFVITSMETSGSGTTTWNGLRNINLNARADAGALDIVRNNVFRSETSNVTESFSDSREDDEQSYGLSMTYATDGSYRAANILTHRDLGYFESALQMNALVNGVSWVEKKPEIVLYVLVDVLGTNRSRSDTLLAIRNKLVASCELTYYGVTTKDASIALPVEQLGAQAEYCEDRVRFTVVNKPRRTLSRGKPMDFPVGLQSEPVDVLSDAAAEAVNLPWDKNAKKGTDYWVDESTVDHSFQNAMSLIEEGKWKEGRELIEAIRQFDPGYPGLIEADLLLQNR